MHRTFPFPSYSIIYILGKILNSQLLKISVSLWSLFCFKDSWLLLLLNSSMAARFSLKQSPRSTGPLSSAPLRLALVALTLAPSHLLYFLSSVGSSTLTLASALSTNHALRPFHSYSLSVCLTFACSVTHSETL